MTVIRAKVLGFCMGVRRAVALAFEEARKAAKNGVPVYTFGPLIHNPKTLDDLKKLGIQSIDDFAPADLPSNSIIIIRAHGISPALERDLREKGCRIVDATCPKVKANQLKTLELIGEGYYLFLAGESNHAEIEGLLGYARETTLQKARETALQKARETTLQEARETSLREAKTGSNSSYLKCVVVGNADDARMAAEELYRKNKFLKTALLGQTTISKDEYDNIKDEIIKFFPNLEIINTICAATSERQQALREMLPLADAVIVAGGEESANTRRLLAIAKESGKPCVLAENAQDIPGEFFSFSTVGLCAGASTPDSVVEEIELVLKRD